MDILAEIRVTFYYEQNSQARYSIARALRILIFNIKEIMPCSVCQGAYLWCYLTIYNGWRCIYIVSMSIRTILFP